MFLLFSTQTVLFQNTFRQNQGQQNMVFAKAFTNRDPLFLLHSITQVKLILTIH